MIKGIKNKMFAIFTTNHIKPVYLTFSIFEKTNTKDITPAITEVIPKNINRSAKSLLFK